MAGQIEDLLVKAAIGTGGLIVGFISGWKVLYFKTKTMRLDYEDLKRRRRLKSTKQDEHLERVGKIKDIVIDLKKHGIPHDQFLSFIPMMIAGNAQTMIEVKQTTTLQVAPPTEVVMEIIELKAKKMMYWEIVESLDSPELPQSDRNAIRSFLDLLDKEMVNKWEQESPEQRNASIGDLAMMLWLTGVEVKVFGVFRLSIRRMLEVLEVEQD